MARKRRNRLRADKKKGTTAAKSPPPSPPTTKKSIRRANGSLIFFRSSFFFGGFLSACLVFERPEAERGGRLNVMATGRRRPELILRWRRVLLIDF